MTDASAVQARGRNACVARVTAGPSTTLPALWPEMAMKEAIRAEPESSIEPEGAGSRAETPCSRARARHRGSLRPPTSSSPARQRRGPRPRANGPTPTRAGRANARPTRRPRCRGPVRRAGVHSVTASPCSFVASSGVPHWRGVLRTFRCAEAIQVPSGLTAQAFTLPVWPVRMARLVPVAASQIRRVRSRLAETIGYDNLKWPQFRGNDRDHQGRRMAILVTKGFTLSESSQLGVGHSMTSPSQASSRWWSREHFGQRSAGPAPLPRSTAVTMIGPYSIPSRSTK